MRHVGMCRWRSAEVTRRGSLCPLARPYSPSSGLAGPLASLAQDASPEGGAGGDRTARGSRGSAAGGTADRAAAQPARSGTPPLRRGRRSTSRRPWSSAARDPRSTTSSRVVTLRSDGPVRVVRVAAGRDTRTGRGRGPRNQVVLQPGDSALYRAEMPSTYISAGSEPVDLASGALVHGFSTAQPTGYQVNNDSSATVDSSLVAEPVTFVLARSNPARRWGAPCPTARCLPCDRVGTPGRRVEAIESGTVAIWRKNRL